MNHDYSCDFILIKFGRLVSGCDMSELMFMALDKNYIDTTTFDVIQPAINYYLKEGTSDQKERTYYYQGCIFMIQSRMVMIAR